MRPRLIPRHAITATALLAGLLAGGCERSDAPPAETTASTAPDKLVFVFQKQKEPADLRHAADQVGAALTASLGVPVEVIVPAGYSASVQALVSQQADVAYVSSLPFLLARRDGGARLILAEQRDDAQGNPRTDYDSIMVARADGDLHSIDDVKANAADLRFCFTSPTSTSGFVFAALRLAREGIITPGQDPADVFAEVQFGGGYSQALQQVATGNADVCAVSYYTMEGPHADVYLPPAQRAQLRIIARTPGVPTHVVCVRGGLEPEWADKIKAALLQLSNDRPELLADVYGTSRFVTVDEDAHVHAAIEAVAATGMPLEGLNP
jgi:phosphonate transport system substrate-binding protein